jgi:hypothetical protein
MPEPLPPAGHSISTTIQHLAGQEIRVRLGFGTARGCRSVLSI